VVVDVEGALDLDTVPAFRKAVEEALPDAKAGLVLNLAATTFVSSIGWGAIIVAMRKAKSKGFGVTSAWGCRSE